ncbi:hypothetical protein [Phytobacter sp. SCO41]|uniref:Uncharacterized protein n=1 Tax=Citrobacter bitternis TaxID=1585982 RepID=A0ABW1Q822_9ENTR|nr:hypothetical protein [Phytobacter sp. SCO41]
MEKFYSLIHSPLDSLIALLGAALLSILGAFIKDWLLRLFSLFSTKVKKRKTANSRLLYRQAHFLLADPAFLSLYSFRALKVTFVWVVANILCILLTLYLQEKSEALLMNHRLNLTLVEMFKSTDPGIFSIVMYMIIVAFLLIYSTLCGYKVTVRSRILFKAYNMRKRQLAIKVKFP